MQSGMNDFDHLIFVLLLKQQRERPEDFKNWVGSKELITVELPPWKIGISSVSLSSERIEELWGVVALYGSVELIKPLVEIWWHLLVRGNMVTGVHWFREERDYPVESWIIAAFFFLFWMAKVLRAWVLVRIDRRKTKGRTLESW